MHRFYISRPSFWLSSLVIMMLALPVFAEPTVTSLTPDTGKVGDVITIGGTGLSTATLVTFGGTPATFTVLNDTYVTAIIPVDAHTGSVAVTTPDGIGHRASDFIVNDLISFRIKVDPGARYLGPSNYITLDYSLNGPRSYSGSVTLDTDGNGYLNDVQPGSYVLQLSGSHWLKRIKTVLITDNGYTVTSLANGDADGNNSIDLFDYVMLDMKFDTTDPMADLDGDGYVNLFDYIVIDTFFGAQGDKPTPPVIKINPIDGAEMIWVPAGTMQMGSNESSIGNESPLRSVTLSGYWVYKNEVTVAQYLKFCTETGHGIPTKPAWGWQDDYPIVYVGKADADAYCAWAGVSLPTEAQWEKAARGTDGRQYPWGNEWNGNKCTNSVYTRLTSPMPVGSFPSGVSPYGCMDMAGNAGEWCADGWEPNYYRTAPNTNPPGGINASVGVVRGGDWDSRSSAYDRCAQRSSLTYGYDRNSYIGFRCVKN